jgi:hypothetical protein
MHGLGTPSLKQNVSFVQTRVLEDESDNYG